MLAFFKLAAVSVNRQRTFRTVVAAHLVAVGIIFLAMMSRRCGPLTLGNVLLIAGIIEGALLIGAHIGPGTLGVIILRKGEAANVAP